MAKKKNGGAAVVADPLAALGALADGGEKEAKAPKNAKTVNLDPEPVKEAVDAWVKADRELKEAKAVKEQAEGQIQEYVEPLWKAACQKDGAVKKSIHVGTVTVAYKSGSQMFSRGSLNPASVYEAIQTPEEKAEEAKTKKRQNAAYDKFFTEHEGPFQLTEAATSNPAFLADLVELLRNKYNGAGYLSREKTVTPKDTLYDLRVIEPDQYAAIEEKLKAAGVRDQKPTFSAR